MGVAWQLIASAPQTSTPTDWWSGSPGTCWPTCTTWLPRDGTGRGSATGWRQAAA